MIPSEFLQILACPTCKEGLIQSEDGSSLHCERCRTKYPIVEGIPILLPDHVVTAP